MTTARLSPGDLERLLETQRVTITSTLERLVPMLLPVVIRENYAACEICGAVMVDPILHAEWHAGVERSFCSAFDAIGP